MKQLLFIILILFLVGCSDDVTVINNNPQKIHPNCLKLLLFGADKGISQTLHQLYTFDEHCNYTLQVSQKGDIVCNSNQNADKKALSNFPTGYIRMDVYKDHKVIYSYYKDLHTALTKEDITDAFQRLQKDLLQK